MARKGYRRNYSEDYLIMAIDVRANAPREGTLFANVDTMINATATPNPRADCRALQTESRPNNKCLRRRLVDEGPQLTLPFK